MNHGKVLRVNCGSHADYIDPQGMPWLADREWTTDETWGVRGGMAVRRDPCLPILETTRPELYRTERCNAEGYRFALADGAYVVKLHFAETFCSNFEEGNRDFSVSINGTTVCTHFDPYREAGGFARPVILEVRGCVPEGGALTVDFENGGVINAVEVVPTEEKEAFSVRKVSRVCAPCERVIGTAQPFDRGGRSLRTLFIGNSGTFYWAIDRSVQAMLATGQSVLRIEPERALAGGKTLAYHFEETDAVERIKSGHFDLVVLQEGTRALRDDLDSTRDYVGRFVPVIREAGARPVLYSYPGHEDFDDALRQQISKVDADLAAAHEALLVPACEAFRLARAACPDVVFHDADGVHLGLFGGYVVASTFYAALSGLSAAQHPAPAILAQQVAIPLDMAGVLQRAADQAIATAPNTRGQAR